MVDPCLELAQSPEFCPTFPFRTSWQMPLEGFRAAQWRALHAAVEAPKSSQELTVMIRGALERETGSVLVQRNFKD